MQKKGKIVVLGFFLLVLSCINSYEFCPLQTEYISNVQMDGIDFKFKSFNAIDLNMAKIEFKLENNSGRRVVIKNNISIKGRYFKTNNVIAMSYIDLLGSNNNAVTYGEEPYEIFGKQVEVELICQLEEKGNVGDWFTAIKNEKFEVILPSILIDGKEYRFKEVDFIYKK